MPSGTAPITRAGVTAGKRYKKLGQLGSFCRSATPPDTEKAAPLKETRFLTIIRLLMHPYSTHRPSAAQRFTVHLVIQVSAILLAHCNKKAICNHVSFVVIDSRNKYEKFVIIS